MNSYHVKTGWVCPHCLKYGSIDIPLKICKNGNITATFNPNKDPNVYVGAIEVQSPWSAKNMSDHPIDAISIYGYCKDCGDSEGWIFSCDGGLEKVLSEFNNLGYLTSFSCIGHIQPTYYSESYLSFNEYDMGNEESIDRLCTLVYFISRAIKENPHKRKLHIRFQLNLSDNDALFNGDTNIDPVKIYATQKDKYTKLLKRALNKNGYLKEGINIVPVIYVDDIDLYIYTMKELDKHGGETLSTDVCDFRPYGENIKKQQDRFIEILSMTTSKLIEYHNQ